MIPAELTQGLQELTGLAIETQHWLREASKRYMIFYSKLTPTVYTSVRDSGVLLTLRYLTEPRPGDLGGYPPGFWRPGRYRFRLSDPAFL